MGRCPERVHYHEKLAKRAGHHEITHPLDLTANWTFIESLVGRSRSESQVEYIFVDYRLQRRFYKHARKNGWSVKALERVFQYRAKGKGGRRSLRGIIRHEPGHRDHYHIRFKCAEGDELFSVRLTRSDQQVLIVTAKGQAIRFKGMDVRHMGRVARGVRGIEMRDPDSGEINDRIVGVELLEDEPDMLLLTITENGYGKRTPLTEYRVQKRGGKGIINIRTGKRNGPAVGSLQVHEDDKIMLITDTGRVIKTRVSEVRETGRAAMGVTLMRVDDDERVVSVARVVDDEDDEISEEAGEE